MLHLCTHVSDDICEHNKSQVVCGVIKNLRWWCGSQPHQTQALVLLNFTGWIETDSDSFCMWTRGFQEWVKVVYQKEKKKKNPLIMTQCVKKLLSDSMGINQGYLPASKKSFLSQLLWILNFKVKFSTSLSRLMVLRFTLKKMSN